MSDLKNVEIFKVGVWNRVKVTPEMLDDLVSNFDTLSAEGFKVPLKFGHRPDEQIPRGQPAIGWVTALKREGGRLLANFSDVPTMVSKAFEKKLYRTVSIEMLMGAKLGERLFRHVLDAVALLGADKPAVHTLGDLDQFLAERSVAFDDAGRRLMFETVAGSLQHQRGDTKMDAEIEARFAKLEGLITKTFKRDDGDDDEVSKLRKELRDLKDAGIDKDRKITKLEADKTEFEAKHKKDTLKAKREACAAVLEGAVKAKKLTPAARESFENQYALADDVLLERLDFEQFKKRFEVQVPETGNRGGASNKGGNADGIERPAEELNRLVFEHMSANKVTYAEALPIVQRANPELARAYLNMNRKEA